MSFLKHVFFTPAHIKHKGQSGFVILYAILLTTVIVTIALAVLSSMIQQVMLAGTQRDSQTAFYSADAAMECVLYWDFFRGDFTTSNGSNVFCDGRQVTPSKTSRMIQEGNPPIPVKEDTFTMNVPFNSNNGVCASVQVVKKYTGFPLFLSLATTTISSRGYNTSCPGTKVPRRLERGLRVEW